MNLPSLDRESYQTPRALSTDVLARLGVIFLLLCHAASAVPVGCWWKDAGATPADCDFLIVKRGIAGIGGDLKETPGPELSERDGAWITHRLKIQEKFVEKAGEKLGAKIAATYQGKIGWVEFDFEPLVGWRPWIAGFHKAIKRKAPETKIHYAVPFFSKTAVAGNFWSEKDMESALQVADGLDIMIYDTGAKSQEEYERVFQENLSLAGRLLKNRSGKRIVLGVPAYSDKTRLHRPEFENLRGVLNALHNNNFCADGLSFAVYAGWTLTAEDKARLGEIKKRLGELCP